MSSAARNYLWRSTKDSFAVLTSQVEEDIQSVSCEDIKELRKCIEKIILKGQYLDPKPLAASSQKPTIVKVQVPATPVPVSEPIAAAATTESGNDEECETILFTTTATPSSSSCQNATTSNKRDKQPYSEEEREIIRTALRDLGESEQSGQSKKKSKRALCAEISSRLGRSVTALMKQVRAIEVQEESERDAGEAGGEAGENGDEGTEEGKPAGGATAEAKDSALDLHNSRDPSSTCAVVNQKRKAFEIEQPAPAAGMNRARVKVEADENYFHDTNSSKPRSSSVVHQQGRAAADRLPNQDSVHADSLIWSIYTGGGAGDLVSTAGGSLSDVALAAVAAELHWPAHRVAARLEDLKVMRGHI